MDKGIAIACVLDAWRANPFEVDPECFARAEVAIARHDLVRAVAELLDAGDPARAKKLLLALGHRAACRDPDRPPRVLLEAPDRLFDVLPRPRTAYLRVVRAAGRCWRGLRALRGQSEPMRRLRSRVWAACFGHSLRRALEMERVVRDHDVLLFGETGTGKELVALAILEGTMGGDEGGPAARASLNVAAVPETLVESELFGHVRGAYTGAGEARVGRIRTAAGGCLFLDEVGDLPLTTQVKLLRVLETGEVTPVGSDTAFVADLRYVTASHKDLATMVARGEFRQDLYERLAGYVVRLPPLRERPEDIPEIADAFIASYSATGLTRDDDADRIHRWLRAPATRAHGWPGNVRELQNALRNLMLGLDVRFAGAPTPAAPLDDVPSSVRGGSAPLEVVRDWYVARVMQQVDGNMTEAARILGVDRTTVRRYVRG